jgi:hypothetical protein
MLVVVRDETHVATPYATTVDTTVVTPVALQEEEEEEEEEEEIVVVVSLVDTPLSFPTKNATAIGGPSTYYDLLHETY